MDIYRSRADIRLDERQLAQDFGISRTPVREAMAQLEREGFVRLRPMICTFLWLLPQNWRLLWKMRIYLR
jgi:DNA-binding FadR family transcriptional regulator